MLNKNKKGYFFLLDGLIAISVLVTGFVIIGSIYVSYPIFKPSYHIGEDLLGALANTNISDINLEQNSEIMQLFKDNKIDNNASSILQQVGKFFYDFCEKGEVQGLKDANSIMYGIINNIVPRPYYAEINFTKEGGCGANKHSRLYTSYIPNNAVLIDAEIEGHKENSKILISTQRVILGNYDETTIFGPYIVRLNVWR